MDLIQAARKLSEIPPQSVVVFVGSGFCVDLGLPTWTQLLERLTASVEQEFAPHAATMRYRMAAKDYARAADPAFEQEVSISARVRFFNEQFEVSSLNRRHRLLARLPVAAFVTTNYDTVIERAIQADPVGSSTNSQATGELTRLNITRRMPTVFNGVDRFTRFNSYLPIYVDNYAKRVSTEAIILKIHNDLTDPEQIVLTSRSFSNLPNVPGFAAFYNQLFVNYSVLFLGFGGDDPNMLATLAGQIRDFAALGTRESFLILPSGSPTPGSLVPGKPIHPVHYDSTDGHKPLDEFLKAISDAWSTRGASTVARQEKDIHTELDDLPNPEKKTIFSLIVPAIKTGADLYVVDLVAVGMVGDVLRGLPKNYKEAQVVAGLQNEYALSAAKATELTTRYLSDAQSLGPERAQRQSPERASLHVLTNGCRRRALSVDPHFQLESGQLEAVIRDVIAGALQMYGGSLAMTLIDNERPSRTQLSDVLRALLRDGKWQGVGDSERTALGLAFSDLFMTPNTEEGGVLGRLALTATSLGLIHALPDLNFREHVVPHTVFLDTTSVLPLVAQIEPRAGELRRLCRFANRFGFAVVFLETFIAEVEAHYRQALWTLRDYKLRTIGVVKSYLDELDDSEDYRNVFLLMLARNGYADSLEPQSVLREVFRRGKDSVFQDRIEALGITVSSYGLDGMRVGALGDTIMREKENWYERSSTAREILAKNEAAQILVQRRLMEHGKRSWFVTDDAQLRRLVKRVPAARGDILIPMGGALGLLRSISSGDELSQAFPRLLWHPSRQDQADQILADVIRELLPKVGEDIRLPVEAARELAVKTLVERAEKEGNVQADLVESEPKKTARQSVFEFLGAAIAEQRAVAARDTDAETPRRAKKGASR